MQDRLPPPTRRELVWTLLALSTVLAAVKFVQPVIAPLLGH